MSRLLVVVVLPIMIAIAAADCFTVAVASTADCFQAISCDVPGTVQKQMEACRKVFDSNIVKSQCAQQMTSTPASTVAVVKALLASAEPSPCSTGVKAPAEDVAKVLRQQIASVDGAATSTADDDGTVVLNKKPAAPLLTTSEQVDESSQVTGLPAKPKTKPAPDPAAEESSESTTAARSVVSKPGFGSFMKKVGGAVGGVAGGVANVATRTNPILNVAGAVLPQKQQAEQKQDATDKNAAAAVANAGAAVASAGAAVAKTADDEKASERGKATPEESKTKTKELVAVEHNGKLAKIVEVGDEESAPKARIIKVDDDKHDGREPAERSGKASSRRISTVAEDSGAAEGELADETPSVIVDSRGRFRIPDGHILKMEKRKPADVDDAEHTETRTMTKTTAKPTGDESGASGGQNSSKAASAPGVVVQVGGSAASSPVAPSAAPANTTWIVFGLVAAFGVLVLIAVFVIIRRMSNSAP